MRPVEYKSITQRESELLMPRQFHRMIPALLIFPVLLIALACPALAQGERVTLLSQHTLNFSYTPAHPNFQIQRLTDERIFFDYATLDAETTAFWKQFGVDNMVLEKLEVMDMEGNSIKCESFREFESDEDDYFSQVIIEPDGFIYEFSFGLSLDEVFQYKRSFNGEWIWSSDKIFLNDYEKCYVYNVPPYRVSIYPFAKNNPIRMRVMHVPSNQMKAHALYYGAFFAFLETEEKLGIFSTSEKGEHSLRFFDADCNLINQIPASFASYKQVIEDQDHLYFFVQETSGTMDMHEYTLYSYDKHIGAFQDTKISYHIDGSLEVIPVQACADGMIAVLTDNQTRNEDLMLCGTSTLALLDKDGMMTRLVDLGKRVEWTESQSDAQQFLLLVREVKNGQYVFQQYGVN